MDKTLENTWKTSITTMFPTFDDEVVLTMMMTHTGSSPQCQEVGIRKGVKTVGVIWVYSVVLVCLV
jgi:hypothetical protein